MDRTPSPEAPQFCPWCGTPTPYQTERHTPLWQRLADERGVDAPDVVRTKLHTDAFVGGCRACKHISHVIGHRST